MTEPLQRIHEFIKSQGLIKPDDHLIIAVSGGMDSMFLLYYLINKKYNIAVAHCNFGLRGEESDGDETFIRDFCETNSIKCHFKKFETDQFSNTHKISIQMAARDLRYQWFNEICEKENYTKIVTAHHKTDNAETILLNLLRGTGLKGLEGIAPIKENKIRPLLCLTRSEIKKEIARLKIQFREDSSNKTDKYHRNRLRLNVLPELKKINPDLENTIQNNAEIIKQANGFITHYIESIKKDILKKDQHSTKIEIDGLLKFPEPKFILHDLISEFGFNASDVDNIFRSLKGISGKRFSSLSHRILKDRKYLIIEPLSVSELPAFEISHETITLETPHHHWTFEINDKAEELPRSKNEAVFDLGGITFPLTVRPWQMGDKLKPLGMKGHKKVSDILIDKKLSVSEKERIWVLVSGNTILWLAGLIINEDHKLTKSTQKILKLGIKAVKR